MTQPVKDVTITCAFGVPGDVWAAGKHTGTDYRAAVGTSIYATRGGTVEHVGWGGYGSAYGYHIILRCRTRTGATRKVLYAHMSGSAVRVGQKVLAGTRIGASGDTGNTFGPHLHYEERTSPYGYYNYAAPVFPEYKPLVAVSLKKLKPGAKNMHVAIVRRRLRRHGIKVAKGKHFNDDFKRAYSQWQKKLGLSGADANGLPGEFSLNKLGLRVKP